MALFHPTRAGLLILEGSNVTIRIHRMGRSAHAGERETTRREDREVTATTKSMQGRPTGAAPAVVGRASKKPGSSIVS